MCRSVLPTCVCVPCVCKAHKTEKGSGFSGTGVKSGCEPPCAILGTKTLSHLSRLCSCFETESHFVDQPSLELVKFWLPLLPKY